MAVEIRQYSVTIPAGTPDTAPYTQDLSFPARTVDQVEIEAPAGSNGFVGFRLDNSSVQVIPYGSALWIVSSGAFMSWPLDGYVTSGSWQLTGYNLGSYDHTIYVRFLLSLPTASSSASAAAEVAAAPTFAAVLGMTSGQG